MRQPRRVFRLGMSLFFLAFFGGSFGLSETQAQTGPQPMTKEAVEEIIRQYILDHPEVLMESVRRLQERQRTEEKQRATAAIAARQDDLLREPASPVAGNPKGDVTIVEFFDYRCGYCKRMTPVLRQLLGEDPNLRVVFKELPILGQESALAARAALAAHRQGKYLALHEALMASDSAFSMPEILTLAKELRLDTDQLQADMNAPETQSAIQKNRALAQALGITGTPAFVIGTELVPGAIELPTFKELIARARKR